MERSPCRSRRRFLGALASSLAAGAVPLGCRDDATDQGDEHVRAVLRAYFQLDEHPEVREVAAVPPIDVPMDEPTRALELIRSTPSVPDAVAGLEAELLLDFEDGRMTTVGGWQLAGLEVELLTLVVSTGV